MNSTILRVILWFSALFGLPAASALAEGPKELAAQTGAEKRWAFKPVKMVDPPADSSGWFANPIDRFVRARLRNRDLEPAGPADKLTLIRRASFDLIGLPPTPEEVDAFVADPSPEAYAKVVERLLASPRYGERWGRHWLDTVRYADTAGFENDQFYPNAWRYRDYVIRSFNADKPFDRFLQEQVAGDELWPGDPEAAVATGLYTIGPVGTESASVLPQNGSENGDRTPKFKTPVSIFGQLEYEWLTDAADTTGAAFLGLTLGCARCHDHKYDPITQHDYYALQAVFAASDRPYPDKARVGRIKALNGIVSDTPLPKNLENEPRCTVRADNRVELPLFHRGEPLTVHRLSRGELNKPREVIEPAIPAALLAADRSPNFVAVPPARRRAAFAQWLTSPQNPLTARVLVNRVWGWHFGQALVRTPNDFGAQGEPPTHPELLDWLARDFMGESGAPARGAAWSLKRLHRRILLSDTYKMQSVAVGHGLQDDPQNRLLWHFPRRRLEGEAIRDAMLACAGTLNLKAAGPPVVPPLGSQELTGLFGVKEKWPVTQDVTEHTRRSIYLLVRRTFLYPLFAAFDPPEVMTSCARRPQTVVPTQALTLLNSPLAREQSRAFARRLLKECGDKPESIVPRAWQLAFGRPATSAESERAWTFLRKGSASTKESKALPARPAPLEVALTELCLAVFNANEFVYVD